MKRILLVDFANSIFTQHHFKNNDPGWKFLTDLRTIASQFKIDRVVFACEGGKSAYRLKLHPEYKAQREKARAKWTPADQARYNKFKYEEMPECLEIARKMGIRTLSVKGVEADDVVSYVVRHLDLEKFQLLNLTTDGDMWQLLRPGVVQAGYSKKMIAPMDSNEKIPAKLWMNTKQFQDQYEITPAQYAHVKALAGDTGDNYLSPKGLGETFALKMIQQYGSIEEVEKNLDTMKIPKMPSKVIDALKADFKVIYHNFKLANLNHTPETDLEIFGEEGLAYLDEQIDSFMDEPAQDIPALSEICYERGKVNLVDRLELWLAPFRGGI